MRQKLTISLILSFLILILLLSIMNGSIYISFQGVFSTIPKDALVVGISVSTIAGLIVNGLLIRSLLQLVEKETELNTQAAFSESLNDLFRTIKSQRHDFNNHVHTLFGMIKENMIEEAKKYMTDVFKVTRELNEVITVDRPEVAALLKAKHGVAVCYNINFKVMISCSLNPLKIKSYELVKLLGNIIDNAFDAAISDVDEKKDVILKIHELNSNVYFEVLNPGCIPDNSSSLFKPGISMKTGHSGLGLYIVKEIVEKYNGHVKLENVGDNVKCTLLFPV